MDPKAGLNKTLSDSIDEFQFEEYSKVLDDATNELKKYLDKVLEMRLQCAELELELATLYKPDLTKKIMTCQKTCIDCKGLIFDGVKDSAKKGILASETQQLLHSDETNEKELLNTMTLPESKDTSQ